MPKSDKHLAMPRGHVRERFVRQPTKVIVAGLDGGICVVYTDRHQREAYLGDARGCHDRSAFDDGSSSF